MFARIFTLAFFLCALVSLGSAPVQATTTKWQELGGGKARVLIAPQPDTDHIKGAIEVRLKQGWSTYWRYPGSSGIPPRFDFSASTGMEFSPVRFPVPSMLGDGAMSYAGYKESVIFPFSAKFTTKGQKSINLSLLIGLCKDVCIPAQASFTIGPEGFTSSGSDARRIIGFSSLNMPLPKAAENLDLSVSLMAPGSARIRIKTDMGRQTPVLYIEGPIDWNLLPVKPVKGNDGHLEFHLDIPERVTASELESTSLFFTLSTGVSGIEFRH